MSSKITIIGAGSVGSTIAYTLSNEDIASEIVLIDINKKKVEGEVMDIAQGTCFRDPVSIIAGEYEDAKDSDIVIITSGIARKPGQTRIELTQTNVNILKSITPEIVKAAPNAIYIIAVSYTHLDVYKRQSCLWPNSRFLACLAVMRRRGSMRGTITSGLHSAHRLSLSS